MPCAVEDLSHGTVIVDASVVAHPLLNAAAEVAAGRVPRRSGCSGVASTACGYVKLKWPRDVALNWPT